MWTRLLREKREAFNKFKKFKGLVEQETGEVSVSLEFNDFCGNAGIRQHLKAPYTPQHNGVVERRNRTLMEMTRSILKHMRVQNFL